MRKKRSLCRKLSSLWIFPYRIAFFNYLSFHKWRLLLSNDIKFNPGLKSESSQYFTLNPWNVSCITAHYPSKWQKRGYPRLQFSKIRSSCLSKAVFPFTTKLFLDEYCWYLFFARVVKLSSSYWWQCMSLHHISSIP